MSQELMTIDRSMTYQTKEAAVIIAALAFVIAVGGVAVAGLIICGWKGAKQVVMDFLHGKATFVCR